MIIVGVQVQIHSGLRSFLIFRVCLVSEMMTLVFLRDFMSVYTPGVTLTGSEDASAFLVHRSKTWAQYQAGFKDSSQVESCDLYIVSTIYNKLILMHRFIFYFCFEMKMAYVITVQFLRFVSSYLSVAIPLTNCFTSPCKYRRCQKNVFTF